MDPKSALSKLVDYNSAFKSNYINLLKMTANKIYRYGLPVETGNKMNC